MMLSISIIQNISNNEGTINKFINRYKKKIEETILFLNY